MLFSSHVLAMNVPKHARANSNMILYLPKPNNLTKSNVFFFYFLFRGMLSSAHVLAMDAKHLLDVIDKIRMNYRHVNELILRGSPPSTVHSNSNSNSCTSRDTGTGNSLNSHSLGGRSTASSSYATTSSSQSMSDNGGSS